MFSSAKREDVKSIYDPDNRWSTALYQQQEAKQAHLYCMKNSKLLLRSDRSLIISGPRLRQHHSQHQKPSVERHWAASRGKKKKKKTQQGESPVALCSSLSGKERVEPNRNTAHQTMNWPPSARETWVHPLQAPQHISYSFLKKKPLSWLIRVTGRVGLCSEMYTRRSHIRCWGAHSSPTRPQLTRKIWHVKKKKVRNI